MTTTAAREGGFAREVQVGNAAWYEFEDDAGWSSTESNEVVTGLHQGGWGCRLAGYDLVVTTDSTAYRMHPVPDGTDELVYTFRDGHELPDVDHVREMARRVAESVEDGRTVLVRCAAGLNRSGMVTARALMFMGHSAERAISLVRNARGGWALGNSTFTAWLRSEDE